MDTIQSRYDPSQRAPKYQLVANAIRGAVDSGELTEGDRLPPVRDLAWRLGITPGTVARAYGQLTDLGLLHAEVGRGTFVAAPKTTVKDDVWARREGIAQTGAVNLFSPHLPDVGQIAALQDVFSRIGLRDPARLLAYPTRDAYRPVREAVVHWLRDAPLGGLEQSDVVLTHGGQNAILTVMQATLTGPKPVVLVEELSYAGFRRAAELQRADVVSIPVDADGVIPEALAQAAKRTGAQLFCTSPEVQNPTGHFTPAHRRQSLSDVAAACDLQILEDDCYRMGDPRAPSYRMLAKGRGWYVSSISKTLTPALRVGYAVAPQGKGARLRRMAEYGFFGLAQPLAEATELLLTDPRTQGLVADVRRTVAAYVKVAVNALGSYELHWLPDVPFVWLTLPSGWRAAAFTRAAESRGIQIRSADEFALRDGRAPSAVRISVNAQVSIETFETAMATLRDLLEHPPEQISV